MEPGDKELRRHSGEWLQAEVTKLAFILASAAALSVAAQPELPPTPARPVVDRYFGQVVVDPYRWMERFDATFVTWLRAQDDYARATIQAIPAREKMLARVSALDIDVAAVSFLQQAPGDLYFYLKAENKKLYVRKGLQGAERLLLVDAVIDYFAPSLDAKYVAYGVSMAGPEGSVLRIVETATGRNLPDQFDRTRFAQVSWLPDNQSFLYWRSNKPRPTALPSDANKRTRTYLHVLGSDPDKDRPIFGYGVSPSIDLAEIDFPAVAYTPGSPYVIAAASRNVNSGWSIYAAPLTALRHDPVPWKQITAEEDEVAGFAARGNDIYLLSRYEAPRYKVLRTSLIRPDLMQAKTVVAPSEALITEIATAKDGLYVRLLDGGVSRLKRVSYANDSIEDIPLPFDGTVAFLATDPRFIGTFIELGSWTHSPIWYRYTPENKQLRDTTLQAASPVDFSEYESLEAKARSSDGTMVPLSIVLRKGSARDGSHPTLLYAYGAYGVPILPSFEPKRLAWLERGGILAYAHVRGGGEYGEEWHRAGQKQTKMNTIDDLIACAEYLVQQKFTSLSRLAGTGVGAGGIAIGRAITRRPDLFAAAVIRIGALNPLRMEMTQAGPQSAVEFGTVSIREEFEWLRAIDPYVNVTPNTKYPAVLLTIAMNESRVPPWQQAKMAARLQAATISGRPVLLRVDYDASHSLASKQSRDELADIYATLLWQFGYSEFQPAAATPPEPTPAR